MWGVEEDDLGGQHQCRGCGYEFTIRSMESRCPKCGMFVKAEGYAWLAIVIIVVMALLATLLGVAGK